MGTMNITKSIIVAAGLLSLASCAGQSVRLSGGAALTELHGEANTVASVAGVALNDRAPGREKPPGNDKAPGGGGGSMSVSQAQTVKDTASDGKTYRGRVELNQAVSDFERLTAGIYLDVGMSRDFDVSDDVESEHLSGGAIFRYYLTDGDVRPFVEGRAGYRHTWLNVGGEKGNGGGLDAGGGVGVEIGPAFILFEYSTGIYSIDDFDARTDEFGVMLGGTLDF